MSIEDKIFKFITDMNYLNNEHVLGILFYGSYLTGLNTENSDIDLHIIFDNEDPNHLIRGNKIVDGTRVEYFEKPLDDIYQTVNDDYINQNNAAFLIFGTSKIIYAKDSRIKQLQEYVVNKFSNPLPPLSDDEAKEQVSIINNRMEKLEKYAETNYPHFEHLYHLTIEKIRRFYHRLMGIPWIETSKGFKLYTDERYRKAFCIDKIPEYTFIDMYFEAITNNNLNNVQKYNLLNKMYEYTKRDVILENDYRIPIKSRNIDLGLHIIEPTIIEKKENISIPPTTLKRILTFIKEVDYLDKAVKVFEKPTFPSLELGNYLKNQDYNEVELCGLVSNICVLTNAVIVKASLPNARILIDKNATDSFNKELQEKCFDVLEGIHIEVINR